MWVYGKKKKGVYPAPSMGQDTRLCTSLWTQKKSGYRPPDFSDSDTRSMKPCFIVERLSRDDNLDGDSYSIQNQKKLLTKVAREKGYTNLVHFYDDGISGVTMERPGFKDMPFFHPYALEDRLDIRRLIHFGQTTERNVLPGGELVADKVLKEDADLLSDLLPPKCGQLSPSKVDPALIVLIERGEYLHEGRFSGAVDTDKCHQRTTVDIEVYMPEGVTGLRLRQGCRPLPAR